MFLGRLYRRWKQPLAVYCGGNTKQPSILASNTAKAPAPPIARPAVCGRCMGFPAPCTG